MRIDLPQCNLKNCIWCFDGNCTSKNPNTYKHCEYQIDREEIDRLNKEVDRLSQCVLYNDAQIVDVIKEFIIKLKEYKCSYDLDNYHSFEAVELDVIDDVVKEFLGEKYEF